MTEKQTFDPKVEQGLKAVIEAIGEEAPQVMGILDAAKQGELDEQGAMLALMELSKERPDLMVRIMDAAKDAFLPTREETGVAQVPRGALAEVGDEAFWSGVGLPQMNPLMEAALAERAQFDGDMPEFRTGPLMPGVKPAVAVDTRIKNTAALGVMLDNASQQVRKAQDRVDQIRAAALEKAAESMALAGIREDMGALAVMAEDQHNEIMALAHGSKETDLAGYRRGELPAPVKVPVPDGGTLLAMTESERKEGAWKFLSTTQGRRTAVEALRTVVFEGLVKKDVVVELREYDPRKKKAPTAYHEWSVNLSGQGSVQPAFNIIDNAGKALAAGLAKQVGRLAEVPSTLYLEVIPVNTVDIRAVGWAARLVP